MPTTQLDTNPHPGKRNAVFVARTIINWLRMYADQHQDDEDRDEHIPGRNTVDKFIVNVAIDALQCRYRSTKQAPTNNVQEAMHSTVESAKYN